MDQQEPARQVARANSIFTDFAPALRYWRDKRGFTQLRLSTESGISQRHISFLESGRSQASREMVLKLGIVLDIPLRERNVMLLAAGYAPAYRERRLSDPELAPVKQALDFMLSQQAPYPALVVDRLWNLVMANAPAAMMMGWLLGMPEGAPLPGEGVNVLKLMLDPEGVRKHLQNWEEVCADLLHWIRREALGDGPGSEAANLLAGLTALPGVGDAIRHANPDARSLPFLPMKIRKDGVELNLFTSIATMGTPHDVTVHELRIESFFPADDGTSRWFRERAATQPAPTAA
ncbi:MAG TPA: helix-turn-helix domain-containing protein [Telluria sp.]